MQPFPVAMSLSIISFPSTFLMSLSTRFFDQSQRTPVSIAPLPVSSKLFLKSLDRCLVERSGKQMARFVFMVLRLLFGTRINPQASITPIKWTTGNGNNENTQINIFSNCDKRLPGRYQVVV